VSWRPFAESGPGRVGCPRLARAIPPLAVAAAAIWLIWPALAHAVEVWSTTEEFGFGFLVPPIAAALVWWDRRALRRSLGPGHWAGLLIVLAALALYLLGVRVGINALAGVAVSPLLWGIAIFLWGWRAGRVLAFPIFFLAFGLGLFRGLLSSVGFALQAATATGAAGVAHALGVPVAREGLVLRAEQFAFVVAEECSGMSSLVALLALAALWAHVAAGSIPARLALLLSVVPLVVVANTARVTAVLLVAHGFGQDAAVGFFHGASSLVLFGVAVGGMLAVGRATGCRTPRFAA
jgi:exosortase